MKYRNTKTGFEIDAVCEISGGDWQPVKDKAPKSTSDNGAIPVEKKKSTKKKD